MSFAILHMSNLHITGIVNQSVLKFLISDIENKCIDYDKIIIVVTGDIIEKGKFNDNTIKSAKNFLHPLKIP